jgi:UDP-perosamine 4-acetyltransferase
LSDSRTRTAVPEQRAGVAEEIVIFGAGGHAKVVIDTCVAAGLRPVVCLGESKWNSLLGVPVEPEANAASWLSRGILNAAIAIGNNQVRERVGIAAADSGFTLTSIISPFAYVASSASVGAGTVVMAGAVIQPEAVLGIMNVINTGASIDHECRLGRAVHVAPHATLCGNVVVGDRTWIGAGSTVIEGIYIEADVFVAAGAAVVTSIRHAGARIGGVPARPLAA